MTLTGRFGRLATSRAVGALVVAACTSGSGFVIAVAVARVSTVDETGRFAIAATAIVLATTLARSAVTDPLVVNPAGSPGLRQVGRASVIGLIGAVVIGLVALMLHSEYLLVGALTVHGLTLRECVRAVRVARGGMTAAVVVEATWLLAAGLGFGGTALGLWNGITAFTIWVGAGAVLGYAASAWQHFDVVPRWRATPVATSRSLAYATDTLIGSGVVQAVTWVATAIGGLTIAAALRGAGTLAGPVTVCLGAIRSLLIPRAVSRLEGGAGLRGLAQDTALLCVVASPGLVALGLMSALPPAIGRELLGETWPYVAPILTLTAVELLFQLIAATPESAHRALGCSGRILFVRSLSAIIRIPAVIAAAPHGITALVVTASIVTAANAALWWLSLLTAPRSSSPRDSRVHEPT